MRRKRWLWGAGAASLLITGALVWWLIGAFPSPQTGDPASVPLQLLDSGQIESGRATYQINCAQCHGANAEGQPYWLQRNPDGTLKAPPHDATGHTWHHSAGLLFRIVQDGGKIYETPGFKSNMPAFGDRLSSDEIRAVITYFKSLWGPEERSFQSEVSQRDPFP